MSCRGYSPKAVSLPKSVKRAAARIQDAHTRGAFIKSYVTILEGESRSFGGKGDKK